MAIEVRTPLTRTRVLGAAVELADRQGLEGLTMRKLAEALGVEAMSLYYHVANKEELLDGMYEVALAEVNEAVLGADLSGDWKKALRTRVLTARRVMLAHRWAAPLIESRKEINLETMRYFDGVLGHFVEGGFSYDLAHHALHALGSRVLGFTQELFEPDDSPPGEESIVMMEQMAQQFPHLVGMMATASHDPADTTIGWCDDQFEFEFTLDLILDGLERLRDRSGV